jgi:hypothetical protein
VEQRQMRVAGEALGQGLEGGPRRVQLLRGQQQEHAVAQQRLLLAVQQPRLQARWTKFRVGPPCCSCSSDTTGQQRTLVTPMSGARAKETTAQSRGV